MMLLALMHVEDRMIFMRQQGERTRYPGVYRIGQKSFRVRAVAVDPRTGKEKAVEKLVNGVSAQQASRFRDELTEQIRKPVQVIQPVRVGEFAQLWMRSKTLSLDEGVAETYAEALEKHILPVFGDLYYDVITKAEVQAWVDRSIGSTWHSMKKSNKRRSAGPGEAQGRDAEGRSSDVLITLGEGLVSCVPDDDT